MSTSIKGSRDSSPSGKAAADVDPKRRVVLRKLGRFAAVTPPAVTLLMTARAKPAAAVASAPISSRQFKEPVAVRPLWAA